MAKTATFVGILNRILEFVTSLKLTKNVDDSSCTQGRISNICPINSFVILWHCRWYIITRTSPERCVSGDRTSRITVQKGRVENISSTLQCFSKSHLKYSINWSKADTASPWKQAVSVCVGEWEASYDVKWNFEFELPSCWTRHVCPCNKSVWTEKSY